LVVNDNIQRTTAIDGLEKISRLIPRYTEVEHMYFQGEEFTLRGDLEDAVIKLYAYILEFEARAACQFSRNTVFQTARNVIKADDWEGVLGKIEELEIACEKLTLRIDAKDQRARMKHVETILDSQSHRVGELLKSDEERWKLVLEELKAGREEQNEWCRNTVWSDCHRSLRTTPYEENKDRNPDRVPGTCEWFLKHPRYRKWRDERASNWLWVTADPGCGKSVLSKFLIDDYQSTRPASASNICYFFFKDDSEENKSATHALCAVLHQLFSQNNALIRYAIPEFQRNGDKLPQLFDTLWSILVTAAACPDAGSVICVLDALDECAESSRLPLIKKLASFYSNSNSNVMLKFIVTSRPNTAIGDAFLRENLDLSTVRLMGENEAEMNDISAEIDLVIKDRVRRFRSLRRGSGVEDDAHIIIQEQLNEIENRTYLWVSLIFPELEKSARVSKKKLLEVVKSIPSTVFEAYEKILAQGSDVDWPKKLVLLHIIVAAVRPLTLAEMNIALSIKDGDKSLPEVDLDPEESFPTIVRELCGLFVSIRDSKIYLIHQTAKEFLVLEKAAPVRPTGGIDPRWKWGHSLELGESNLVLAKICVLYLQFSVFESHPLVAEKWGYLGTVDRYTHEHGFLDYAAKHWADNFREANIKEDKAVLKSVLDICDTRSKRFMTWFLVYWTTVELRCPQNFTDLMVGSYFGHEEVVKLSLKKGVDVDSKDATFDRTPLLWAAGNGHKAVVKLLLQKGARVDVKDTPSGQTPLLRAAGNGQEVVVKLLLEKGSDAEFRDNFGRTPLSCASQIGSEAVVRLLLEREVNVDSRSVSGWTPLSLASTNGHEAVVKLLLERKADVDSKSNVGWTPLSLASLNGHGLVVKLLLEKGSDADSKDKHGGTPLSYAAASGHLTVMKLLLEEGVDVDSESTSGRTPLSFASENGQEAAVRLLLEKEVDVDSKDTRYGGTPLSWAAQNGHRAVMKLLLEKGADVDPKSNDGRTPLSWAAWAGDEEIVKLLLESGAGVDSKDTKYGRTPLMWAAEGQHIAVVELLKSKTRHSQ
jgi:ankyrin repeat protein